MWIALGVGVTVLLRAPWFNAPLGRDEGGVALVARAWHGSGAFPYGSYFLDRPPLLPALYRLAGSSETGIRLLGATAAALVVVVSTSLAVRVAGRAAAPWAAGISAVLASSAALKAVFTPAELLAVVPSAASVLVLLIAIESAPVRLRTFAAAGALATVALLVKQSFADALVAGGVALVAGKILGLSWRETLRRGAAYATGVAVVLAGLLVWVWADGTSLHSVWYAMFGFRLDAAGVLTRSGITTRLGRLDSPLLTSGLLIAAIAGAWGIARLPGRPLVRVVLAGWILAAITGIALGGSYWPHYLIALIPGVSATAAIAFTRQTRIGAIAMCAIAIPTAVHAFTSARSDSPGHSQKAALAIARYVRARAVPHQTLYVLYAKVNVLYYAGLDDPFPYNWSLMIQAVPGAEGRLRGLLASSGRPTWVVRMSTTRSLGLDRSGATQRLLARHYRSVGTVCGATVFLERGASGRSAPPTSDCPRGVQNDTA
jgi:4-amino-4-deoxy-L-arabinose transferase-like glycosyltransferase